MRYVQVMNVSTGEILAEQALVAETLLSRFMGLQGKRTLPKGSGLVLMPTNAIHTLFMMMPIDAVFVSQAGKVLRIGRRLHPWRLGPIVPRALYCIELPAEKAAATSIGHTIELRPPVDLSATDSNGAQPEAAHRRGLGLDAKDELNPTRRRLYSGRMLNSLYMSAQDAKLGLQIIIPALDVLHTPDL